MGSFNIGYAVKHGILEEARDRIRWFVVEQSSTKYRRIQCILSKSITLIICDVIDGKPLIEVEVFNGQIVVFYHNNHGHIIKCYHGDLLNNNCIEDLVSFLVLTIEQYIDNGHISHSSI